MKSKLSIKVLGVVVTVATLASLLVGITAAPVSAAAPGALAWTVTDTPSNVNNVLGGDTYNPLGVFTTTVSAIGNPDINFVAASADGKAIFGFDTTNKTMYKSTDGVNWNTSVGINTIGTPVGLVVSPKFATDNSVALATTSEVWLSTNGGTSFVSVAPTDLTTKLGTTPSTITSIDLGYWFSTNNVLTVLVGTKGAFAGAGVATSHVLDFVTGGFAWNSVGALAADTYAVKISPNAISDGEIMAVTYSGAFPTGVVTLTSDFGSLGWNNAAYPDKAVISAITALTPAFSIVIAVPSDYTANTGASILIGTSGVTATTNVDDVYRVYNRNNSAGSVVKTGLAQPVYSLAINGPMSTATVFAGIVGASTVSRTSTVTASTITWSNASVTGNTPSIASTAAGLYAGTIGTNSAISVSADGGVTFQAVGAIDVGALVAGLLPVSLVNFTTVDANTMFVVIADSSTATQYVFKTVNAGVSWQEVYYSAVAVGTFPLQVAVSTGYATDSTVVIADGTNTIRKSVNGGASFASFGTPATATTALFVIDGNNIFVGASTGNVYKVGVFAPSTGLPAGSNVYSFALNPKDATKATFLVGLYNGTVWETTNAGVSFTQIGGTPGGANPVIVTYAADGTRYAAVTVSGGAYYFNSAASPAAWSNVLPAGAGLLKLNDATGVAISADGGLYATDKVAGNGLFRTLAPTASTVEFMEFTGVSAGSLVDLNVISGAAADSVYVMDTATTNSTYLYAGRILGFSDTLIAAAKITAPATGTVLTTTTTAAISWPAITGATAYQLSFNGGAFTTVGNVTSWTFGDGNATVGGAALTPGSSYTWAVRASTPIFGRASATNTFITALPAPVVSAAQFPLNGAVGVPVDATFSWPAVPGATYEFVLAEELGNVDKFAIIDYSATTPTNAIGPKETLKNNTLYWWRVRAVTATSTSAWTTSFFTTAPAPVVTTATSTNGGGTTVTFTNTSIVVTQQPATTVTFTNGGTGSTNEIPAYLLWAVVAVGAVLVISVIVLIVRTRKI